MELKDKRVVVTGGGSGIGLALARAFAKRGATVFITGRRAHALEEAAAGNPGLVPVVCDVTDDAQVRALKATLDAAGGADVLVNNAGVMAFFNIVDGFPLDEQIKEIHIDAVGPIRMIEQFLPALLKRDAMIINVSSGLAYVPFAKAPVYSAAKAFVHAYTLCLREQLRGTSVRVVELLPPVVDTPLAKGLVGKIAVERCATIGGESKAPRRRRCRSIVEDGQRRSRRRGACSAMRGDTPTGSQGIDTPFAPMPPEKLAEALMRGLRRGKVEIAPGISTTLKWMGRLLPALAFRQMNKR